ncbi:MAG TPA: SDR family oxidoreductase [Jatrophihabitans sp.]|nr:SDR family oxidoreductase [Jatrophihabitans sp.]
MRLAGAIVVVTGAGSGIGAELARRFVAEGAGHVVLADRNADAAHAVAAGLGDQASAVGIDVTDEAAVHQLVTATESEHGPVDLFCSNAGVALGVGLDGGEQPWQLAWDVHVMAHLYAARAVLPGMLRRGTGYLLNTASAAGLLSAPGDAPYSVTKHAAVALAEWLAYQYRDRGIRVSVLCPMGVDTPLLMDGLHAGHAGARAVAASGEVIGVERVADAVVRALADETFLVLPHPQVGKFWAGKAADPDRWLAGMAHLAAEAGTTQD